MNRTKLIDKVVTKKAAGECYFCGVADYDVLECHRIIPGEDGGKYQHDNVVVACGNCHSRVHAGQIVIDRKYLSSNGKSVLHYWENGIEHWK